MTRSQLRCISDDLETRQADALLREARALTIRRGGIEKSSIQKLLIGALRELKNENCHSWYVIDLTVERAGTMGDAFGKFKDGFPRLIRSGFFGKKSALLKFMEPASGGGNVHSHLIHYGPKRNERDTQVAWKAATQNDKRKGRTEIVRVESFRFDRETSLAKLNNYVHMGAKIPSSIKVGFWIATAGSHYVDPYGQFRKALREVRRKKRTDKGREIPNL